MRLTTLATAASLPVQQNNMLGCIYDVLTAENVG